MAKLTVYVDGAPVDLDLSNDALGRLFEQAVRGFRSGVPGFWVGHTDGDGSESALWVPASMPVKFGFDGAAPNLTEDGEPAGT